ncbi:hypothetical protein OROGR_018203 [Orobanche gracilis]
MQIGHGQPANALKLYRLMQENESFMCNKFTISSALSASAAMQSLCSGKEIHGHIMKTGLDTDAIVWRALLDLYGKCGSLSKASYIFDRTVGNDVVSWTSMIDRYFRDGKWEEGLSLFSSLLNSGIKPDEFTFAGILNECAHQTAEELGKQVHGHMIRTGFHPHSFVGGSLVHMYTKCGSVDRAHKVLDLHPKPDLVSYTSLIDGYAQNGQPEDALKLFDLLLKSEKYGLSHTPDHYACMVDLLSRAGRFKEAEIIIDKMPIKPDKFLWASLLGGCRIHGNYELAERAAEGLFNIEPENAATYVTLAIIYATLGKWSQVAKIRKLMDEKGVVKKPGMSWINPIRARRGYSSF